MAHRMSNRGMRWTALSTDLRRVLSFFAKYDWGSYVGNWSPAFDSVRRLRDGEDEWLKCGSDTRVALDDRCIVTASTRSVSEKETGFQRI
ncbi:hypothetical protein Acr_14g0007390 [Actinidia rufa]|uniref:Uncharacterized protein n=1 Tax=Actinidia rufa TaxID=165716 RepID=A0A7J0FR99_9ERIC|nr:hypothetical protein Acr_14g0007390 [Actinidia rufa]